MVRLNEIKKILEKYGVELPEEVTLINADARLYDYYGYKYAEQNSCTKNANVLLQFKHEQVEKPFWIAIFQGAQYKSAEELFIIAFWKKPFVEEALYRQDGINKNDEEKDAEVVLSLRDQLNFLFFKDTEERDCLYNNNPNIVYDLANEIENIVCLNININIPHEKVSLNTIKELKKSLQEAEEAYRNNEGKKLLAEMLDNDKCPQMLKDFCEKHSISKVLFEEYVQNEDYMPDYGYYIVLEDETGKECFGFLSGFSGCYGDIGSSFDATEFKSKTDFAEKLKEEELLVSEDEWTTQMTDEAFVTWKYVVDYEEEGNKRELFL